MTPAELSQLLQALREQEGLITLGFPERTLTPHTNAVIQITTERPMVGRRLILSDEAADGLDISRFEVRPGPLNKWGFPERNTIEANTLPLPGSAFKASAFPFALDIGLIPVGAEVCLCVFNRSEKDVVFGAMLLGREVKE